jgi:predicted HTH transcriptional regulator
VDAATACATAAETATASAVGRAGAESPAATTRPWKREDAGERGEQNRGLAQQRLGQGELDQSDQKPRPPSKSAAPPKPGDTRLDAALAFIKAHGQITATEVRELLHLQRSQGLRVLRSWEQQGKIVQQGRGRGVHYVLPGTGAGVARAGMRGEGGEGEGERQRGRELEMARAQAVQARATLPARLQVAVRIAAEAGRVTRAEYAKTAKVSQRTAKRDLAELVRGGRLRVEGEGKRRAYTPSSASACR